MKKLDDIPKKDFFEAPQGYFDSLPGRISMRIEKPSGGTVILRYSLRYALPILLISFGVLWYIQNTTNTAEEMLADIDTDELVSYLAEADMSYEDFMEEVKPGEEEANTLEQEVFDLQWQEEDIDELVNELDNTL